MQFDEEVMLDGNINKTTTPEQLFGRKTMGKLIKPERCVYVDETGVTPI
jgi:hypothetical protein